MKRYFTDRDGEMFQHDEGDYVLHSQAAALLQLAEEKLQRAERERIKAECQRDEWKNAYYGSLAVYRDIGNNLGADMPRELVNDVARRRMRQLQVAREALQGIARSYPETEEGETLAGMARTALEDIGKC